MKVEEGKLSEQGPIRPDAGPVPAPALDTGEKHLARVAHVEPQPWARSSGDSLETEAARSPVAGGLPAVAQAADLPPSRVGKGWMALCFGVTFMVYAALIPRFILYSSPP